MPLGALLPCRNSNQTHCLRFARSMRHEPTGILQKIHRQYIAKRCSKALTFVDRSMSFLGAIKLVRFLTSR